MKKYVIILFIIAHCMTAGVYAAVGDWTTFTNQGDIRDIVLNVDDIWCATK